MKVLQLGKFYPIQGGVEKVMYDLMSGLSERGIDCDMLCACRDSRTGTVVVNRHARLLCCKAWMKYAATMISPAMVWKLRKVCGRYDVIHIHHPDPMACFALYVSGYKGKVVLHWHSDIVRQRELLRLYRPLQDWLIKRADVIVGTTPVYLQHSPFLSDVQDKAVCVPIGIQELPVQQKHAADIRLRYQGKKIIFSLGRLIAYKGFRYLIEAAKYLGDGYVILIGGSGPLKASLEKQIADEALHEKVVLLGFLPGEVLPAYYQACDLFCLSSISKTEAFGIVQLEAMSCGKPVVATDIPGSGVPWVNAHQVSGLNVPPKDARALAEAIRSILEDETVCRKYAAGARARYLAQFTEGQMIEKCLKIYSDYE